MISRRNALEMQLARQKHKIAGSRRRPHTIEVLEQRTVLDASLQLIHNSPYDIIGTFDLYVNDVLLVDNFAFQNATPFLNFAPGNYNIEFAESNAPNSSNPFFSTTVSLADNISYVALATGNPQVPSGPGALSLAVSPLGRQFAQNPANVEMFFMHGVPDSPPIDITLRGGAAVANDLAFGNFAPNYVSVPPANYTLDVSFNGADPRVLSFGANLTPVAGGAFVIAASDYLNPPAGVFGDPRFALLAVFPDGSAFRLPDVLPQPLPTLSISGVTANEGNAGTTAFVFTASLSANSNLPITVGYGTSNGSATAGSDYTATSGTLTFLSNVTSQVVTVLVAGDNTIESNETFSVSLSGATGATIGTGTATGTIQNDDSAGPVINFATGFANAASQLVFNGSNITRIVGSALQLTSGGTGQNTSAWFPTPVNVNSFNTHFEFQLTPGTTNIGDGFTFAIQSAGTDALGRTGQDLGFGGIVRSVGVKFDVFSNAGEGTNSTGLYTNGAAPTSQNSISLNNTSINLRNGRVFAVDMSYNGTTLTVVITDTVSGATATQNYTVNIPSIMGASPAYVGFTGGTGTNTAVQRVLNWTYSTTPAPTPPTVSINSVSANEGNSGTTPFVFTASLSAASTQSVTVRYATSNGTATSGSDYTATTGTITFAPGATTQLVTVQVAGDTTVESDEAFSVVLSSPTNATLGTATGTGTIVNDDVPTTVSIASVSANEGNSGSTPFVFTASLSAASTQSVTVRYATSNGTATSGSDYTATTGTITFAAGTTTRVITVQVAGNTTAEPDETFSVTLSSPTNAALGTAIGIGTIINDDAVPIPSLSINNVSANEGNAGTSNDVFTVNLSAASTLPVTVRYATSNGTATAGSDYTAATGTATFAPGTTSQLVTVPVTGDTVVESSETFTVTLSSATNATLGTSAGTGTILNDDSDSSAVINFPGGFSGASSQFSFNGSSAARINGANLQLTDGGKNLATSAYFRTQVGVSSFNTRFSFQLTPGTNNIGDGFTFVIQRNSLTSRGASGGSLGYGGINRSVAVKFDTYSNAGEGTNSTGQYSNGQIPTSSRSVNLNGTGVNLRSGNVFTADMTYDGTTLSVTITDTVTGASATQSYTVNIPSIVGANTAYVGFTAGTGTNTAVQRILNWTYSAGPLTTVAPTAISAAIEAVRTDVSIQMASVHSIITAGSVASSSAPVTSPATVTLAPTSTNTVAAAPVMSPQVATAVDDIDLDQPVQDDLLDLLAKSSTSVSQKKAK